MSLSAGPRQERLIFAQVFVKYSRFNTGKTKHGKTVGVIFRVSEVLYLWKH